MAKADAPGGPTFEVSASTASAAVSISATDSGGLAAPKITLLISSLSSAPKWDIMAASQTNRYPASCFCAAVKLKCCLSTARITRSSQSGHHNRDKVDLEQLSPGQPVRVQNESNCLWDLTGEVIDIRPDKLSYLIDIEGRTFVRGHAKIKPVFKVGSHEAKEGGVLESESHLNVGVLPDGSDTSDNIDLQSTVNSAPPLRRSSRLLEKCVPSSSSASACGLSSGVGTQHVPFSYSLPCPALVPDAGERLRKRSSINLGRWPNSTGITHMRTPLTSPTLASRCSTFNGPVLLPELQPWELSRSSVLPSSSAAFGRPRMEGDDAKTWNVCLRPSS